MVVGSMRQCLVALSLVAILATLTGCETSTPEPTRTPRMRITMFVCGYDRCRDSCEYGQLVFRSGISVWENWGDDRGQVVRSLTHGSSVVVVDEKRSSPGPRGAWYRLESGGWVNGLWLTAELCSEANLDEFSFTDCLMGEY